jgi:hypothetical protein
LIIGKTFLLVMLLTAVTQSCTNLDEEVFDNVTPDKFFQNEEQFIAALGAAYTALGDYAVQDYRNLQEVTTDEMVVPTRGQDWNDGGEWRVLHLHSYKFENPHVGGPWGFGYNGVNTANRLIFQFQGLVASGKVTQESADAFIAELKVLRAFFYWVLLDIYGNVPIVTEENFDDPKPPTDSRADVYAFIESELKEEVPKLSKNVDGTTYARMNYYAGQALLAKLYLNAVVYINTPKWNECIAACDEVINSGEYSLEPNYFANFNLNSQNSDEFIFAVPYDKVFFTGFQLPMQTLHYGSQFTYNLTEQPWNGFCTMEEFYNSYEENDLRRGDQGTVDGPATRRGNFLAGFQWRADGTAVLDDGFESPDLGREPEPFPGDPDGAHLNFTPAINELGPQALRQSGARIGKWEFEDGGTQHMSNDYAVYRLAEVILMKAEAEWRNGNATTALALVNQIRARAGVSDLTTLDGPVSFDLTGPVIPGGELLNEKGREMFAENSRRTDLIRFGLYTSVAKWALPTYMQVDQGTLNNADYTQLFPIPRPRIDANDNLVQNPGY